jgi:prepilin-type N-terminal cleavage/methylation domain-containing protein
VRQSRKGFSLIEVLVALVILTVVLTGLGRFVGKFIHGVTTSSARTTAAEVARSRIERIKADPRYTTLTTLFGSGASADTTGFPGFARMRRRTFVVRDQSGTPARDWTTITVKVTDPSTLPGDTISLTTTVAAP